MGRVFPYWVGFPTTAPQSTEPPFSLLFGEIHLSRQAVDMIPLVFCDQKWPKKKGQICGDRNRGNAQFDAQIMNAAKILQFFWTCNLHFLHFSTKNTTSRPRGINPKNLRPLLLTTIRSFNGYLLHSGERVCASKSHDDWDSWCWERNKKHDWKKTATWIAGGLPC